MPVVWITGAKGFIGRHLALHLSTSGDSIYGIGHGNWPDSEALTWGVQGWINGDIDAANLDAMRQRSGPPSCIFHLAGGSSVGTSIANPLEDFSRTVSTTARLLEWIRTNSPTTRFVTASSAAVYGVGHTGLISENVDLHPFSPYGHHKLMMEQMCHNYSTSFGLNCSIVRLFSVYGAWLQKQLLWDICSRLAQGIDVLTLGGTGQEVRDWTEVRDVVRLLQQVSSLGQNGVLILNGGSGIATSVADIAKCVIAAWETSTEIKFNGSGRPGDPFSLVSDPYKLCSFGFDWEIGVTEGISDYVKWFRKFQHES